ncbi:YwqJ-related putative deaminase [Tenacibaculum mesophilum]|uniref:YwqJ-related putative deaminase n=1 Tax=Tenacibaculum mesophilum TaxID=104268 RepID=UPI00248FDE78|nr:YwqJ-related putative deaminase [Tenacibaculum mesophilum]
MVFIESGGGTNAFGTVFRIHKGKNVKTLPEVDRLTLSKVAKAFGVQVQTNDLSEMIKEELAEEDSVFYLLVTKKLLKGGRIIRWSTKDVFTDISGGLKNASKEVNKLKLGEERWNTAFKDESGSKYNPLLPKLRGEGNLFDVEKFSNDVYKTYIQPAATQATSIAKLLLKKGRFAKLIPFDISKVIEVLDAIPKQLQDFFDSVSNHLLDLYEYINGLLVGLINSIIEFVKSFIDILAMLFDVLNAAIQSTEFFENPASYLSLFAESFENLMDSFVALFTLENLKAIFGFIASMPAYAVKIVFRFLTSDIKVKIDPGALGYYIGFFVGFVASEVVTFFLTGGTGTIAKALKETLRSYKALAEIPKKAAKALGNTVEFGIDTFVKLGTIIADFIKDIPKHLKTLRKWLDEFFEGLSKVARAFKDDIYTLFEKLDVAIKKVRQQPVLASGVPVPVGENLYALVKDGKELFRGTKKEIDELAEKLKKLSEAEAKKYLGELEESLIAIKAKRLPNKTNLRLQKYADEVVEAIQRSRDKKGAVCVIQYKGESFYGKSFKGYSREELPPMHHLVEDYIKPIHKKMVSGQIDMFGQHGKCAEVDALSQLFYYLEKIYGRLTLEKAKNLIENNTISKALEIHKKSEIHGRFKEACKSCNPMLKYFEIIEDLTELKK